jgi:hypothetical protein
MLFSSCHSYNKEFKLDKFSLIFSNLLPQAYNIRRKRCCMYLHDVTDVSLPSRRPIKFDSRMFIDE